MAAGWRRPRRPRRRRLDPFFDKIFDFFPCSAKSSEKLSVTCCRWLIYSRGWFLFFGGWWEHLAPRRRRRRRRPTDGRARAADSAPRLQTQRTPRAFFSLHTRQGTYTRTQTFARTCFPTRNSQRTRWRRFFPSHHNSNNKKKRSLRPSRPNAERSRPEGSGFDDDEETPGARSAGRARPFAGTGGAAGRCVFFSFR